MDKAFRVSLIIFAVGLGILLLTALGNHFYPADALDDPEVVANYGWAKPMMTILNAISGIDLLVSILALVFAALIAIANTLSR